MAKVDLYAQTVLSPTEDVCAGELKQYKVEGSAGSTIYWSVEGGAVYNGGSPVIDQDLVTPGFQYSELIVSGESLIGILWNVTAGDYLVRAFEETAGSCVSANMDLTVTVSNLPDQSLALNNPAVCPGGTASITLTNSESGVNYQLRLDSDDSDVGTAIAGTGGNITFDVNPLVTTVYNVYAENLVSTCGVELDNKSTVTVEDVIDPVAVCKNITIQLDATGNASITPSQIDNGSTDNCTAVASLGFSLDKTNFTCADLGANTVVLTVTDETGNVSTCTSIVTVTDNEDPTAICKDITIQLDASGNASITAAQIDNGSSDNCGIASMSLSKTDFNCDDVSTNQVVASSNGYSVNIKVWPISVNPVGTTCDYGYNYTVTLGYDISFSGSGIPAGLYTLQGTLGCGGFFSLPNGGGSGTVETANAWRGASDCATITPEILGCTDATIVIDGPGIPNQNISLPLSSPNTVELTVVDNSGNTSTCSANVFVEDNAAPTAICKDITIQLDATGNASIVASDIDGGSSDACGILSMTASMTSFGMANVGENTVTLTVTDNNGNVSICDATVTVEDDVAPTAICKDITVQLDVSGNASITAVQIDNGSSDASGISDLSVSPSTFSCSNIGANTVTLTVTDNNSQVSTCTATVTVQDVTNPLTPTLADVTGECGATATVPTTTDACAGTITGTTSDALTYNTQGTHVIAWTFDDGNGNSIVVNQNVIIADNKAPVADLASLPNVTAQCEVTSLTAPTATDNCDGAITGTHSETFPLTASKTVVWTYTDGSGNSTTQTQNVVINDTTDPVADAASLSDVTAQCEVTSLTAPTATDNCDGAITGTHSETFPITASKTVVWTYTDGSGNTSTQTQNVVINDTTDPIADAASLSDVTAQCEVTSLTAPTATDNCDGAITGTHSEMFPITASKTVVWTYTDGSGNSTTQTQNVVINDTTDPVADAASLSDVTAQCEVTSLTAPTATDNCDGAITGTHSETFPITASKTVVWTYTDGSGNSTTQTQNVVINDTTDPVADAASLSDVTAQCEVTSLTAPTATDNCDGAITGTHSETFPITASKTVVWTYTDGSGNTSTQTQNVVINDTTDPIADAASLSDVTAQCEVTSLTAPTATDNCDGAITGTHSEMFPITASKTVVWTYTDGSGNSTTQTQNVVINDTTDPVADAASLSDVTAQCEVTSLTAPTATDNCDGAITGTHSETFPITASKTVVWTYTDGSGNTSTQTQNVVINDTTDPVADAASLSDVTAQCEVTSLTAPTATDNCSVVTVTSDAGLPINTQGTTVVTWTYKDVAGNTSTQTQNVIINDNIKPTITCLTDIMQVVDAGSCDAVVTYATPIGSDNCAGASTAQITGLSSGSAFPIGTTTNTFEVTDVAGNKASCSFNVTVTKENNIAVVDVSGSLSPETSDGSDNNNGNHCSDMNGLQAVISPSGYTYSPGTSQVQFRVDRLCDAGTWSFAYSIGGAGVNVDKVLITDVGTSTNSSGVISVPSEKNYVLFTIDVDNVVGTTLLIDFTISNGGTDSAIKDAITIQHNLKMIPQIVGFD